MLRVQNVTKHYGKVKANDDISFQVDNGHIAVLLGPNGSWQIHYHQMHSRAVKV